MPAQDDHEARRIEVAVRVVVDVQKLRGVGERRTSRMALARRRAIDHGSVETDVAHEQEWQRRPHAHEGRVGALEAVVTFRQCGVAGGEVDRLVEGGRLRLS